jgi:DNA-binding beta-propeller fold protein YncE
MTKVFVTLCLALLVAAVPAGAQPAPSWHLVTTVPLGAPDRWDFVHLSADGSRVYVAHQTRIDIIDAKTGKRLGSVGPIDGAHGVADIPGVGKFYAGNGRSGVVSVFDSKTFKKLGDIPAKTDADAMEFDSSSGLLIVADGDSGFATLIDPTTDKNVGNIVIGPGAEGIATDGRGHAFINISDRGEMVRLDLAEHKVDAHWPLAGCESPHGLALDRARAHLFVSCRNATMLIVDAVSGKIMAKVAIGRGTDSAAFDPERKLAFSANKDGTISVVAEVTPNRFQALAPIVTAPGAATLAEDPHTGRIYIVTSDLAKVLPPKRGSEIPEYVFKQSTLHLLIFEPL